MSFATNGMRQGTPRVMATASLDQAMAFSNCNVIDYKQGLNFGMDVAPTMPGVPTVTVDGDMESRYSLNLDRTGHTVDMQISHAKEPEYRQSDSVDISELAGKISREMVQNKSSSRKKDVQMAQQIESLKRDMSSMRSKMVTSLTSESPAQASRQRERTGYPVPRSPNDVAATANCAKNNSDMYGLHVGLEHHTQVLQRTQKSISRLDSEIQNLKSVADANNIQGKSFDAGLRHHTKAMQSMKQTMSDMDSGLVNHTSEIRTLKGASGGARGNNTDKLQTMQRQLDDLVRVSGKTSSLTSLQSELGTLRSEIEYVSKQQTRIQEQMQTKQAVDRQPRQQTSNKLASLLAKYDR